MRCMGRVGLHALTALMLAGCSNFQPYTYLQVTGDNIEVTDTGRAPWVAYGRGGVGHIPTHYLLEEPGVTLKLALDDDDPHVLTIVSPNAIREVRTRTGFALRKSPFEYIVSTGIFDAGSPIEVRVDLEDGVGPVVISGVIVESGWYFDCRCGL
jgi:hypothetical protein